MAYSRGTRDDYDRWANITEDGGWSWDNLFPYMIKVRNVLPSISHLSLLSDAPWAHLHQMENLTTPSDHRDTTGEYDPAVHGYNGMLCCTVLSRDRATHHSLHT